MLSGAERGSKSRDNALHCVCCVETINSPLSRRQQTEYFSFRNRLIYIRSTIGEKRLFLQEQKQTACVHRRALRRCTLSPISSRCA